MALAEERTGRERSREGGTNKRCAREFLRNIGVGLVGVSDGSVTLVGERSKQGHDGNSIGVYWEFLSREAVW